MSYIGTEPKDIRSFGRTKFDYTASQGQTAFTGADDDGKVLAFTVGQIEVYVNGILMDDSDFTTTGTGTVTLASAANLNDIISIVSFESNIPDNNYVPASGGTFTGAVTHTGTFTSVGIDDNADATSITIDSDENVGIGTAALTASGTVQSTELVANNAGSNTNIRVQNTASGSGSSDGFLIQNATNSKVYLWNYESADVLFGTNGTERMKIDGSGRVTTPNQPRFRAHKTVNVELTSETTIVYNATTSNVGSHYNTSNGQFTAPVAGLYRFQAMHYHHLSTGGEVRLHLYKNGSLQQNVRHSRSAARAFYERIVLIEEVELAANDYVYITGQGSSGGQLHTSNGLGYADFYGHLIG